MAAGSSAQITKLPRKTLTSEAMPQVPQTSERGGEAEHVAGGRSKFCAVPQNRHAAMVARCDGGAGIVLVAGLGRRAWVLYKVTEMGYPTDIQKGVPMPSAILGKWGNSLAVRIPGEVADAARLAEGDAVEIEARDEVVIVRPAVPRFSAAELFRGRSSAEWRALYADAYDWGPDVGREAVPE
jgi:antitoxin MazE